MSLESRIKTNGCNWLPMFLKDKLRSGDLKTYNMAKTVMYYFPQIVDDLSRDNFELAMKYYENTYICLGQEDVQYRYKVFDKIYKDKHGFEFVPNPHGGESRYITIGELCEYFKKS